MRLYWNRTRIFVFIIIIAFLLGTIYLKLVEKLHLFTSQSRPAMFRGYLNRIPSIQSGTSIFHWSPHGWEQWDGFCSGNVYFERAVLKLPDGLVPIYIHNTTIDEFISHYIKETGMWEAELMHLVHHILSLDENLQLIDIGSNIGEFSLLAAKKGRQVIAVDPLYENIHRLCKSIEVNNFSHLIKVFYTALSNNRAKVSFIHRPGNIGASKIIEVDRSLIIQNTTISSDVKVVSPPSLSLNDKNTIYTVLLDDLLPFVSFNKTFIKMDVEGHEHFVLGGGERFFSSIDIRYVLLEWVFHGKDSSSGRQIIDFLTRHGFSPFMPTIEKKIFKEHRGVLDMLWIKRDEY